MSGSRRAAAAHDQCLGWVDKPLFSRDGARLVFTYHVGRCKGARGEPPSSYLFTIGADGSGLWRCACAAVADPAARAPALRISSATQREVKFLFRTSQISESIACTGAQGVHLQAASCLCCSPLRVSALASCVRRVPLVLGSNHDFGADGKLLVCDASGTYLVDIRCHLGRAQPLVLQQPRGFTGPKQGLSAALPTSCERLPAVSLGTLASRQGLPWAYPVQECNVM